MKLRLLVFLFIALLIAACTQDKIYLDTPLDQLLASALVRASKANDTDYFLLPESNDFASIPQDSHNPITAEKVKLGQMLFFETGLALSPFKEAGKKTYSCASCHVPTAGFRPGGVQGIADGGIGFGQNGENRGKLAAYRDYEMDVQGVRPLSVLNVAFVKNTTWNGRFGSKDANLGTEELWELDPFLEVNKEGLAALESQNIEGLKLHRMDITEEVLDDYGYRQYYDEAFGEVEVSERYSEKTTSFAISAYLRTLMSNKAPFQEYLKGDKNAMTEQEKRGALLFFSDAKCYHCHKEPNLGANEFYAVGVNDLYQTGRAFNTSADDAKNLGRGEFTRRAEDYYKFKIPQLYNLGDAPFYFHGSSKTTLKEVVEYFNEGVPENPNVPAEQIARQFKPLNLTDEQVEDLTAFLETGLRDPDLLRYVPEQVLSGYCFPNNDLFSQIELGCSE